MPTKSKLQCTSAKVSPQQVPPEKSKQVSSSSASGDTKSVFQHKAKCLPKCKDKQNFDNFSPEVNRKEKCFNTMSHCQNLINVQAFGNATELPFLRNQSPQGMMLNKRLRSRENIEFKQDSQSNNLACRSPVKLVTAEQPDTGRSCRNLSPTLSLLNFCSHAEKQSPNYINNVDKTLENLKTFQGNYSNSPDIKVTSEFTPDCCFGIKKRLTLTSAIDSKNGAHVELKNIATTYTPVEIFIKDSSSPEAAGHQNTQQKFKMEYSKCRRVGSPFDSRIQTLPPTIGKPTLQGPINNSDCQPKAVIKKPIGRLEATESSYVTRITPTYYRSLSASPSSDSNSSKQNVTTTNVQKQHEKHAGGGPLYIAPVVKARA